MSEPIANHKSLTMTISALKIVIGMITGLLLLGSVQVAHAEVLLPVNVNGQFGYINTSGQMVIAPQFDSAQEFSEGLAVVGKKSGADLRFGFIDEKGVVRIPIQYQNVGSFSEGRALVVFRDRYGFLDTSGKVIIEPVFDRAFSFSDGMARVVHVGSNGETLYGFVDKQGKLIIKPQYIFALDFNEGLAPFAVLAKNTLRMGFIDKLNRVVIKPQFSIAGSFSEGLAVVAQNAATYLFEGSMYIDEGSSPGKKVMYIDKQGSVVISGKFDSASNFSEGLAQIEIDLRCRYVDKTGRVVIQPAFAETAVCGNFSEGLASINADNGAKFIDKTGKIVIKTDFVWAYDFRGGVAKVRMVTAAGVVTDGYIDRAGRVIWSP